MPQLLTPPLALAGRMVGSGLDLLQPGARVLESWTGRLLEALGPHLAAQVSVVGWTSIWAWRSLVRQRRAGEVVCADPVPRPEAACPR